MKINHLLSIWIPLYAHCIQSSCLDTHTTVRFVNGFGLFVEYPPLLVRCLVSDLDMTSCGLVSTTHHIIFFDFDLTSHRYQNDLILDSGACENYSDCSSQNTVDSQEECYPIIVSVQCQVWLSSVSGLKVEWISSSDNLSDICHLNHTILSYAHSISLRHRLPFLLTFNHPLHFIHSILYHHNYVYNNYCQCDIQLY